MTDQTTAAPGAQGQDGNVDTDRITIGNPAGTCARSCEGNAYQIEIRRLKNRISELEALLAGTHEGTDTNMGVERAYSYSENGEVFTGEFESPEAAAADFFLDHPERTMVDVGLIIRDHAEFYVHGEEIIEGIAMQAMDLVGEVADSWLEDLGRDEAAMNELEELIGGWVQRKDPPKFWYVDCIRTITRADLIAAVHLEA